jgi:hypothetical protein
MNITTIAFDATVMDGKITIPDQYREDFSSVKIILFRKEQSKKRFNLSDDGFGFFAHGANPALWNQEADAWTNAVNVIK